MIVIDVFAPILPAVNCPDDEILAGAPELKPQVGVIVDVVPSLKIAVVVYCAVPFLATLADPEIEIPVN